MTKFTGILAFMLILFMTAGIATSEQVVTKQMTKDGIPLPDQSIIFTKLEISPPYINFMLQPGESKVTTVTLKNIEKIAVSIKPNTVMATYNGNNVNTDWIKVIPEIAEIPAGGSQKFTIKVTVPLDAPAGKSGVQIAFTDETMPAPNPSPFPNYIHALQVSLDIRAKPEIQTMTKESRYKGPQGAKISTEVSLDTGSIITGIVTSLNGTPIADANVYAQGLGYGNAITDINGNYTLGGLQAGDYIISVSPPYGSNFISNSTIVHVSQDETVTVNIILQTGSIITGIITSSNGTPVEKAYVYAQGSGYESSSITDIKGNYVLGGLQAGDYIVSVSPPYADSLISIMCISKESIQASCISPPYGSNFISNSTIVHVSKDETVTANIILRTGGKITGIVTSSNGTPVANAYVNAQGLGYGSAMTDIKGNYIMGGLTDGNYIISVSPPYGSNFITNSTIVHVSQDETVTANIILQTGGIITGIVTASNGTPVADAYIYAQGPGYGSAMTDINGIYMLGGLTDGNYIIGVSPPYGSNFISNSTIVHVSQDETVTANIILQAGGIITGIVTASNGTPVADAYVYAQGPGYGSAMTDINGIYMLGGLTDGNYIIGVSPPYGSNFISNSTIVHVSRDETVTSNIVLQTGGIVTGVVTASNGTPVADAYVFVQGPGYGSAMTDINGNYMMGGLTDGNYIIAVIPPYGSNFISNSTIVHVSQDETITANIVLQTGGIVTGIVTASNGTPVAEAYVYAQGPGYGSAMTDKNGNYIMGGLTDGNYIVIASPPYGSNLVSNSTTVHVSQDETVSADIILETGGIISGIVTSWNGTPVAYAYVYAQGSGYGSSATDIYGNYSIVGLQAGNYVVYAYPPYGNLSFNSTNITVKTGETSIANIILQIAAIIPPSLNSVEIRGEVAEGTFLWDAYNFPAFFYDFQGDVKTETLNISNIDGRIIPAGQLIYSTTPLEVAFAHSNFGKYQVIGLTTDKYFGGYTSNTSSLNPDTNFSKMSTYANGQLHKVLIDEDTRRAISVGSTFALQEGYVLKVTDIDISARTMLLSLLKEGIEVDVAPLSADKTYVYTKNISGVENLPLIMVRLDDVFMGSDVKVAFLKGVFQLSENPTSVKVGDQFDTMKITNVTSDAITMNNYLDISLDKNTNVVLLGNIKLKVADNESLRFYPFVEITRPGKYELRGPVFNGSTMFSLTGRTFGGFYYDLDNDGQSESLNFTQPLSDRLIARNELEYRTTRVPVEFKAYKMEKVHVAATDGTTYDLVGWQGEKWVAIKGVTNKIARLALEMNTEEKKTLTTGETWSLGSGYDITINAIDARTTPRQVWFTLKKDGIVVDEAICQAPQSSSTADKEKSVCYKTMTILGESDVLLFAIYADSIFAGVTSDMVQFKYAWLIDESSAKEIKSADKFGVFEVRSATSDYIRMSNENTVNLSRNTETTLMGDLKLKIADSDNLRFYPKIDYIIGETVSVPVLTTITVSPANAPVIVGNTTTFTATTLDQNGEAIDATVTWSSSNHSVGTIAISGVFTAVAEGTTTITAQSGDVSGIATVTVNAAQPLLVFAITPNIRNAQVGTPLTILMTVINGGTATATNVSITQASGLPVTVSYQQWNGSAFIGLANTPADIAAGAIANYVLTINATSAFTTSSLTFNASSTNGATALISGVNTLTISASSVPSADLIMMTTGTLEYRTAVGTPTTFAVATMNVGTAAATGVSFVVSVPSSITGLVYQVNETNPDGSIKGPATGLTIAKDATPSFAVFITPTQPITLNYEDNRINLRIQDGTGKIFGEQSVAVYTT